MICRPAGILRGAAGGLGALRLDVRDCVMGRFHYVGTGFTDQGWQTLRDARRALSKPAYSTSSCRPRTSPHVVDDTEIGQGCRLPRMDPAREPGFDTRPGEECTSPTGKALGVGQHASQRRADLFSECQHAADSLLVAE
jgi:hypothetical protein